MINNKTQSERLLEILETGGWHCTNEFYRSYMADPRTLICKLKKVKNMNGIPVYNFQWRWCKNPSHNHDGNSKEWSLNGK